MARRATSSTKRQPRTPEPAEAPEQVAPKAKRRANRVKRDDEAGAELPVTAPVLPDIDAVADVVSPSDDTPPKARRGRKPKPSSPTMTAEQAPAVKWDAATGVATFDWPGIEQVAATGGPNQAMAKLLLAARAEGANSRWPF